MFDDNIICLTDIGTRTGGEVGGVFRGGQGGQLSRAAIFLGDSKFNWKVRFLN